MSTDIAQEKRELQFKVEQSIREFELKTGMRVTSFKFKRDDWNNIESVVAKAELPDED